MAYLTYDEYKDLGFEEMEEDEFNKLLPLASDVLDAVTLDYYQFNDLETDVPYRRDKFKKAIACQLQYFYDMGSTSSHGLQEPVSVTIGRTSMSSGYRGTQGQQEQQNNLVSQDVYMYLQGTGLLYRGIGVV